MAGTSPRWSARWRLASRVRRQAAAFASAAADAAVDGADVAEAVEPLTKWVESGGVLVRFAGPHLARTEGIDETGWRLVTNVGPDAGQTVFHLHMHVIGGQRMRHPMG